MVTTSRNTHTVEPFFNLLALGVLIYQNRVVITEIADFHVTRHLNREDGTLWIREWVKILKRPNIAKSD